MSMLGSRGRWLLIALCAIAVEDSASLQVPSTLTRRSAIGTATASLAACPRCANAVDSKGRSEGVFGERGLLTEMFGVASPPTVAQQSAPGTRPETTQEKMARVRKERMAAEARNQSDEYRRLQAGVGTKSFGSTVSVPVPRD